MEVTRIKYKRLYHFFDTYPSVTHKEAIKQRRRGLLGPNTKQYMEFYNARKAKGFNKSFDFRRNQESSISEAKAYREMVKCGLLTIEPGISGVGSTRWFKFKITKAGIRLLRKYLPA